MCVYTQFRGMHSHVGKSGGERVTVNPQAESRLFNKVTTFYKMTNVKSEWK